MGFLFTPRAIRRSLSDTNASANPGKFVGRRFTYLRVQCARHVLRRRAAARWPAICNVAVPPPPPPRVVELHPSAPVTHIHVPY